MTPAYADGLFEARRGLWRSAAESFKAALATDPSHLEARLAAAVCELRCNRANAAVVLLDGAGPTSRLPPHLAARHAWLTAAARSMAGDPLGAEAAVTRLPMRQQNEALMFIEFADGRYQSAVARLLKRRRP